MSACPIDYRIEKYGAMGFDSVQSMVLANTRDRTGIFLYWVNVRELVSFVGLENAYNLLI